MSEKKTSFDKARCFTYQSINIPEDETDYQRDPSIPSTFHMMDISKDKKFMAIIDDNFVLRVFHIDYTGNEIKPIRHQEIARHLLKECNNSLYVFLSVDSETGYVAVSFAQLGDTGLLEDCKVDISYSHCEIYKGDGEVTRIPFQGRAVFTKDSLALVGDGKLKMLDRKTFKQKYFLNLYELKQSYEAMITEKELAQNTLWAKYYPLEKNNHSKINTDGETLIALTRHIKNNILVTTYRGNITKVWSILDGSLIISFKTVQGEYIMAISDDNGFIATYNDGDKKVKIYCSKSALLQHIYTLKSMENDKENSKVEFIRFGNHQRYISFTGTKCRNNEDPNSSNKLFFEVWSITQEKCLVYKEINNDIKKKMPLPFIIETPIYESLYLEAYDLPYFATNFNGVYMTKDNSDISKMTINTFLLLDQNPTRQSWDNYSFKKISEVLRLREKPCDNKFPTLDQKDKAVTYMMDNTIDKFILRFDIDTVQLWRLEKVKNEPVDEKEVFKFESKKKGQNMNKCRRSSQVQKQNESLNKNKDKDQTKYYNSYEKSALLYIRSFKGQHYKPLSTFRDNWKLAQYKDEFKHFNQRIHFMKDEGRIMVDIELNKRLIRDEIFLPLPDLDKKTQNKSCLSRSSSVSTLDTRSSTYYHEIESFSQALHYLHFSLKKISEGQQFNKPAVAKEYKDGMILFEETQRLLEGLIFSKKATGYFNTLSGSKTLAMLASFRPGQSIIADIIQNKGDFIVPIKVFSYAVRKKESENVLTVLMDESKYDLFQLLFNQILLDYYDEGIGNLSAIIDVLLYLQKEKSSAKLLHCIQRLSYLPVRFKKSALLESEYYKMHADTPAEEDEASSLEYLENFTALECISKCRLGFFSCCLYQLRKLGRNSYQSIFKSKNGTKNKLDTARCLKYSKKAQVCIVPLPYFNSYRIYPEISLMEDFTRYHRNSLFTRTALSDSESKIFKQGYTVMEVLVSYKWNAFAKFRFYIILLLQVAYYVSFTIGVSFAEEIFGYIPGTPITHTGQITALLILLFIGLLFFCQEIRQLMIVRGSYFKSIYNYVDLAYFVFSLITFILLRTNSSGLDEFSSVSSLIMWIHFILRLRVFHFVGYLLEMVIQLSVKILPVTVVMIVIVIAFTHSFIVLLRKRDDLFSENLVDENGDTHVNNIFSNPFLAFITVWFFLFGVFDPLFNGELGSYPMVLILAVLFSIIIVLILFNVVIALMSGTVEDISTTGTKCWIGHYASVVAEIELLWCFPSERLCKKNSPIYVYYNANRETVEGHHQDILKETNKLLNKIKANSNRKGANSNESNLSSDE